MNAGNVFRAYDIRGVVDKDFNAEWVTHLGKACGTYLAGRGISSAVIGYDCRHSSPAYHDALVEGILSTGTDIISIGMVPTPALYFAVKHLNRQGGVMITASHNPSEYNGFKVWAGQSTIHGEEIQKIKAIFEEGAFAEGTGTASRIDIIPTYKQDILSRFKLARPVKVVLDGGNGAGGEICADILTKLGATVIPMFCEPDGDFPNHHPDPVVEANMQALMARVKEEKADLGIGLDGDADRLGIVDPDGRTHTKEAKLYDVMSLPSLKEVTNAIHRHNCRAVMELAKKGHRRIAFIHGERTTVTENRLTGFYRACDALGLEIPEEYVREGVYHDPDRCAELTRELLQLPEPPTCILMPDDFSSIGGGNAIRRMGLRFPEDVSAAGYDGIQLASVTNPAMTTYRQDTAALGKTAAAKLIELIEKPRTALVDRILIPGKLVEGGSVRAI